MKTKEMLDQLRAERSQAHARLDLTPDGALTSTVHKDVDRERERQIQLHERAFRDAQHHMRLDHALSRHEGQAKAIFNNPEPEMQL